MPPIMPSLETRHGAARVVQLRELVMILELHCDGLSISTIARRTGRDPQTTRNYIERGPESPVYGPWQIGHSGKLLPFVDLIREPLLSVPDLTATRLLRKIRERGYGGA